MTAVFAILVSLIVVTPALTIIDGTFAEGFILAIAATAIALVALTLHTGELRRLAQLVKPIAIIVFVPCIWMLIQIVPVPGRWPAHPAWMSASAALGKPLMGSISLDIGATWLSLARYVLVVAIAIVTTVVTLDRQRAEAILLLLTAAAVLVAAGLIVSDLGYLGFAQFDLSAPRGQALNIAVIGLILSCATAIRTYENHEMRRARSGKSDTSPIIAIAVSIVALTICLSAIVADADAVLLLAAVFGVSILISVAAIRRLRLGPWGRSGIAAAAIVGAIGFFAASSANKDVDPTISLSSQPQISIAATERMLSDAKWAGTGAGTFEALLPIYRDVDDAYSYTAPTAAASVAVEMGRPFFWGLIILALIGAGSLFKRALIRGRDYYYSAAGAGCVVALLVSSFANAGIFGLAASLLTSVICGLALAQSKSWST